MSKKALTHFHQCSHRRGILIRCTFLPSHHHHPHTSSSYSNNINGMQTPVKYSLWHILDLKKVWVYMGKQTSTLYCMHIHDIPVCMVNFSKLCMCVIKFTTCTCMVCRYYPVYTGHFKPVRNHFQLLSGLIEVSINAPKSTSKRLECDLNRFL